MGPLIFISGIAGELALGDAARHASMGPLIFISGIPQRIGEDDGRAVLQWGR